MNKENKIPLIRFKGYTEDWEQRKLGEMMNVTSVKRIHQSDWTSSGVRFLRARDIVAAFKNEEPSDYLYISEEKYNEYSSLSGKVKIGDLLVTGVGTIGVPMLINSEKPLYFKDGNIIWFQNGNEIDGDFFYYSFTGNSIQNFIQESAGTGTVGTYTIDSGKKTPIVLPQDIAEQQQIGTYFQSLDNLITLHQRKCESLKKVKKSMLQKMFPKNGESVPEIRFAGFTDPWEQRKLGELGSCQSGIGFPDSEQSGKEGIPFFKVSDMNINGNEYELKYSNNYVTDEQIKRRKWKPITDVPAMFFAKVGAAVMLNRKKLVNIPFLLDNNTMAYKFGDGWDTNFGRALFDTINLASLVQVGALPSYNASDVEDIEISMPSLYEQQKIGSYFQSLDNLITLHQRKVEKLKEIKKSMLQKMFV